MLRAGLSTVWLMCVFAFRDTGVCPQSSILVITHDRVTSVTASNMQCIVKRESVVVVSRTLRAAPRLGCASELPSYVSLSNLNSATLLPSVPKFNVLLFLGRNLEAFH